MVLSNVGGSLGLMIAIPLFTLLSVPTTMLLGTGLFLLTGVVGLCRFGLQAEKM